MYLRLLVVAALCVAYSLAHTDPTLDSFWGMYKTQHAKVYATEVEESLRRRTWEDNLRYIRQHNLEADLGKHTYTLGLNQYADLTHDEYRSMLLAFNTTSFHEQGISFLPLKNVQMPDEVDWRMKGYVTEVKNQAQCGSCWAFSATGALEGQHFKKTGKLVSLSEQNLVDCTMKLGLKGCAGGSMVGAFEYVKMNGGIDTEESYPYMAKNGKCHYDPANCGATCTGYVRIPQHDEQSLLQAAATIGPISVAIDASRPSFRFYKSGVYEDVMCSTTKLDHGVLVVGYGTEDGMDYWLVKNSWGTTWGNKGYINMVRNKNQCGISDMASYPTV